MLVGAGPGNSGFMTLQGLRALQEADVIVHDRLVSAEVLDLARRDAARFDVGKFVGGGGATQEEINKLLVEHAQRGEYVVRLKGGDPFVFGRGGEEIDFLRQHGVSYEVIPGITAALAAGAYAGVPLTDRRYSQSVRFLTGNSDEQVGQFNYSDLAAGRETLAFYMSVGRLASLRDKLLAAGVCADMPVAFIENASRAEQRVLVSTVEGMQRDAVMQKIKAPTMMIIGNVASRPRPNCSGSGVRPSRRAARRKPPCCKGSCHCGAVQWTFDGMPESVTACNCTVCRRYGTLWIYDYEGERIRVTGETRAYSRGKVLNFNFCPTCASVVSWSLRSPGDEPRRRIAVNLRLDRARPCSAPAHRPLRRPGHLRRSAARWTMRGGSVVLS